MRLTKLNTRLDSDGRAVVYSEWSKNFPELNGYLTSPENVYELGKVLKFDSKTEEHLYMFCLNNRNRIVSFFRTVFWNSKFNSHGLSIYSSESSTGECCGYYINT